MSSSLFPLIPLPARHSWVPPPTLKRNAALPLVPKINLLAWSSSWEVSLKTQRGFSQEEGTPLGGHSQPLPPPPSHGDIPYVSTPRAPNSSPPIIHTATLWSPGPSPKLHYPVATNCLPLPGLPLLRGRSTFLPGTKTFSFQWCPAGVSMYAGLPVSQKVHWPPALRFLMSGQFT